MITTRGVASLVGLFLLVLALGAIAVVARGQSTGQRTVLASSVLARSRHLEQGSDCPLTLPQQEKAIRAFEKMIPVFRHPRCQNCHGAVDPFTGTHAGVELTREDWGNEVCSECHFEVTFWEPPQDRTRLWAGKSDEWLCRRLHYDNTGASFLDHLRTDRLITRGFEGKRALNDGGQTIYEAETGRPFKAEPPPISHRQFYEDGIEWIKAMGGEFVGSNECGCVRGKIELKMTSEWTATGDGNTGSAKVTATVPLTPDSSGLVFTGEAPLEHGKNTMTAPPGCRVDLKPVGGDLNVTEARFEFSGEKSMSISLAVAPTMSGGTMTFCPEVRIPVLPILPWSGEWQYLHQPDLIGREYHFDEFEVASADDFGGERKLIGSKEVSRTASQAGMTSTAKTTFEFWWLGLKQPPSEGGPSH